MRLLDFLMYYLTLYFVKRPQALSWSSPEQRAIYGLSLITTSWLMALEFCFVVLFFRDINSYYIMLNVLVALGLMWIYNYIYLTRKRLDLLRSSGFNFFNLNDNICISIACVVLLVSFGLPCAVLVLNMPTVHK
jgi:hypothetical protein